MNIFVQFTSSENVKRKVHYPSYFYFTRLMATKFTFHDTRHRQSVAYKGKKGAAAGGGGER